MMLNFIALIKIFRTKIIYGPRTKSLGKGVKIEKKVLLSKDVSIGDYSYVGPYCDIRGKINIGNYFICADDVTFVGGDHEYSEIGVPIIFSNNNKYELHTKIGNDVWIGRNSTIFRGIDIGDGAIIGAGSVVTKNIPAGAIYGGVPAKFIKYHFSSKLDFKKHLSKLNQQ